MIVKLRNSHNSGKTKISGYTTVAPPKGGYVDKEIALAFGRSLRKLRLAMGLTQEALAFSAGLHRNYISSIELGEKQPSLTTILKLGRALNVKPGSLLDLMEYED